MMFWKDYRKRNDIFSLTLLVYVTARVFGFWPFSIEFDAKCQKSHTKVTKLDYMWFIVTLAFYCVGIRFATYNPFPSAEFSFTEVALNQLTQLVNILIIVLCIVMDMVNRNILWKIIVKLKIFDDEMIAMGRLLNFKRHKICLLLSIIAIIVVTVLLVIYSINLYKNLLDMSSASTIILICMVAATIGAHTAKTLIYLFLLLNVKVRFHQLNQFIE